MNKSGLNGKSAKMCNIEIKAKVRQLKQLIEKATSLSNSKGEIIKQHDVFYKVQQGRLKLRKFENGTAELIYYERQDLEGPKLSSYSKTAIQDADALDGILGRVLGHNGVVIKERRLFMVDQTRIHVDSVEGLGHFMELEVVLKNGQTSVDGEVIALGLMTQLGLDKEDLIREAYVDLLKK